MIAPLGIKDEGKYMMTFPNFSERILLICSGYIVATVSHFDSNLVWLGQISFQMNSRIHDDGVNESKFDTVSFDLIIPP